MVSKMPTFDKVVFIILISFVLILIIFMAYNLLKESPYEFFLSYWLEIPMLVIFFCGGAYTFRRVRRRRKTRINIDRKGSKSNFETPSA